jgi:hypothetical protein
MVKRGSGPFVCRPSEAGGTQEERSHEDGDHITGGRGAPGVSTFFFQDKGTVNVWDCLWVPAGVADSCPSWNVQTGECMNESGLWAGDGGYVDLGYHQTGYHKSVHYGPSSMCGTMQCSGGPFQLDVWLTATEQTTLHAHLWLSPADTLCQGHNQLTTWTFPVSVSGYPVEYLVNSADSFSEALDFNNQRLWIDFEPQTDVIKLYWGNPSHASALICPGTYVPGPTATEGSTWSSLKTLYR